MTYCQSLYNDGYSFASTGTVNGINQYFYSGHDLIGTVVTAFSAKFKINSAPLTGDIVVQLVDASGSVVRTSDALDASTLTSTLTEKSFDLGSGMTIENGSSIRVNGDGLTAGRAEVQSYNDVALSNMNAYYYDSGDPISSTGANLTFCTTAGTPSTATRLPPPPLIARF